jgi:signal peptidase I
VIDIESVQHQQRPRFKELAKSGFFIVCNNWLLIAIAISLRSVVPVLAAGLVAMLCVKLQIGAILVAALLGVLLWFYFDFGLLRLMLNLSRGGQGDLRLVFKAPTLELLYYAAVSGLVFIASALGAVLLLVPGIYVLSRLCLSGLLVLDKAEGITGALSGSLKLTRSYAAALCALIGITVLPALLIGFPTILECLFWMAACYLYAQITAGCSVPWKAGRTSVLKAASAIAFLPLSMVCATLIALICFRLCIEARYIPSSAMEPTLNVNDRVLLEKSFNYGLADLKRGDIVVFYPPPSEMPEGKDLSPDVLHVLGRMTGLPFLPCEPAFIKRVVGVPGDTLAVVKGVGVFINGELLLEPYVKEKPAYDLGKMGDIGNTGRVPYSGRPRYDAQVAALPIKVGKDQFFVMGDNRNRTQDSHVWGFLDRRRIIGRAWLRFYPPLTFF